MISADNVFFQPFKTTNGAIPFDRITTADYEPAIIEGMKRHSAEIEAIANQEATPTFENTIVALERSGEMLNRVLGVFYPMLSANADDSLMAVSERMAPKITEHGNSVTLNEKLWQRIDYVYNHFDKSKHDKEDWMLLYNTHESFVRSGAALKGADREKYKELSTRLSQLTLKFDQNALKETSKYEMWLSKNDLDGLPESAVEAAAAAAKAKDREGEYLITLHAKTGIGRLSAYCGAVSAGAGAGAGIAFLNGGDVSDISHTIVNALAITSGIVCDGAKSSCAAKIATAVETGIFGYEMFREGQQFYGGDGLVAKGVENSIANFGRLAREGMRETDQEIILMMTEEKEE